MGSGGAYALSLFDPVTESAEPASVVVDAEAAAVESMRLRVELAAEVKGARSVLTSPDGKAARSRYARH